MDSAVSLISGRKASHDVLCRMGNAPTDINNRYQRIHYFYKGQIMAAGEVTRLTTPFEESITAGKTMTQMCLILDGNTNYDAICEHCREEMSRLQVAVFDSPEEWQKIMHR